MNQNQNKSGIIPSQELKMNLESPYLMNDMVQKTFTNEGDFQLESGDVLTDFQLAYSTLGQLNTNAYNVVWVIHALTGDTQVQVWWSGLVGEDKFYDPSNYFIVCANLLGSCYGSTQPLSHNPTTGESYYYDFPNLTTRDIANALELLRIELGIHQINTLIGGSLGGQVGIEWAYLLQKKVKNTIILASNAKTAPWTIGFNETQRMAISADQTWGEKYPEAGKKGLEAARAIAMLTYRHPENLSGKQVDEPNKLDGFKASSYLRYQGQKLANRFNALSYWTLTKTMDSHDLGRNRGGAALVLSQIPSRVLAIGVDKDLLFLKEESQFIANHVQKGTYREIKSPYGHDAFLIEYEQLNYFLSSFYLENND